VGVKGRLGSWPTWRGAGISHRLLLPHPGGRLLCPFARDGVGRPDPHDYYDLNKGARKPPPFTPHKSLLGYFLATAKRTIPRFVGGRNPAEVQVTFTGKKGSTSPTGPHNFFPITDRPNSAVLPRARLPMVPPALSVFRIQAARLPYACGCRGRCT